MKRKVYVTEEDIVNGARLDPWKCPIARAASRAFGQRIVVDAKSAVLRDGREARLPLEAYRFVLEFDEGHAVIPFSFELRFPE